MKYELSDSFFEHVVTRVTDDLDEKYGLKHDTLVIIDEFNILCLPSDLDPKLYGFDSIEFDNNANHPNALIIQVREKPLMMKDEYPESYELFKYFFNMKSKSYEKHLGISIISDPEIEQNKLIYREPVLFISSTFESQFRKEGI